jgi:hypothetical protein
MSQANTVIPVHHIAAVHEIPMEPSDDEAPPQVTLLELVEAVSEVSENETEVIATVVYMLSSGSVRLSGSFRNTPPAQLCG